MEQDAESILVIELMAHCFIAMDNFLAAKDISLKGLAIDAQYDGMHYAAAMSYSGLSEYTDAIEHLNTALEINPQEVRYYNALAQFYMVRKYVAKAVNTLERALAIDPDNTDSLGMLSQIYYEHIDKAKGKSLMDRALSIDPESKLLLSFKADQSMRDDRFDDATHLLEQAMIDDPNDWRIRDSLIDARLSKNVLYNWLVYKWSGIKQARYMIIFLDLCIVLFGGIATREQHESSGLYPFWFYLFLTIALYRLLAWVIRFISHLIYTIVRWKVGWRSYLNMANHIMLSAIFSLLCFIIYLQGDKSFFWFATSMCTLIFVVITFGIFIIESPRKKQYFRIYLGLIYSMGIINFLSHFFVWSWSNKVAEYMMFVVFVPLIGLVVIDSVKDAFDSKKRKKDEDLKQKLEAKKNKTWKDHVVDWSMIPLFFGLQIIGIVCMDNVIQILRFSIIWGILGIIGATIGYKYLRSKDSRVVRYLVDHETSDESSSRILRVILEMVMTVVLLGMILTVFVPLGTTTEHRVLITEHGRDQSPSKIYVIVEIEGEEQKLRPSRTVYRNTSYGDSLLLTRRRGLFGVDFISDFEILED